MVGERTSSPERSEYERRKLYHQQCESQRSSYGVAFTDTLASRLLLEFEHALDYAAGIMLKGATENVGM